MLGVGFAAAEAAGGRLRGDGFHAVEFPPALGFAVDHVAEAVDGLFGFLFRLDAQYHRCGNGFVLKVHDVFLSSGCGYG